MIVIIKYIDFLGFFNTVLMMFLRFTAKIDKYIKKFRWIWELNLMLSHF